LPLSDATSHETNLFKQESSKLRDVLELERNDRGVLREAAIANLFKQLSDMTLQTPIGMLSRRLVEVGGLQTLDTRKPDVIGHSSRSDATLKFSRFHAFFGAFCTFAAGPSPWVCCTAS
jgi:hypothetical protein